MPRNVFIHLHNNDLRIHDSSILSLAHSSRYKTVTHILPIYVFDERYIILQCVPLFKPHPKIGLPKSRLGKFWRTGRHRARFMVESVFDLKERYKDKGADLVLACGKPECVVTSIVEAILEQGDRVEGVWMQKEMANEEVRIMRALRSNLEEHGVQLHLVESRCMVSPDDLPFKVANTPDVHTNFRKQVEGLGDELIHEPLPPIDKLKPCAPRPSGIPDSTFLVPPHLSSVSAFLPYILAPLLAEPDLGDRVIPIPIPETPSEWSSYKIPELERRSAFPFHGGESTGLARLDDYVGTVTGGNGGKGQGGSKAMSYKDTRNGMVGDAFSTKFSAWLALGCLSGRYVGWRVQQLLQRLHTEGVSNKHIDQNVYWILFELLWRDYFFFTAERFSHLSAFTKKSKPTRGDSALNGEAGMSSTLFDLGGFEGVLKPGESRKKIGDWKSFNLDDSKDRARLFLEGRTGIPLVDANMRELAETGYMSNRGRQNVASFLAVDLYIDWRIGAEWFETFLIDHDVYSNWGNWQYQAGVGNDPRTSRQFNQIKQANDYDPDNIFVRTWLPELDQVDDSHVQSPWTLPDTEKEKVGLGNGDNMYPARPMLEQPQWKKHYRSSKSKGFSGGGRGGESKGHGEGRKKGDRRGGRDSRRDGTRSSVP